MSALPTKLHISVFFSHPWHKNQLLQKVSETPELRSQFCFVGKNRLIIPVEVAELMQRDANLSRHFRLGHGTDATDRRRKGDKKNKRRKKFSPTD